MAGYMAHEEETATTMRGGRLHTGDVGYIDEDGYVFIIDRIKDLIITGGFNVYPRMVEEAVLTASRCQRGGGLWDPGPAPWRGRQSICRIEGRDESHRRRAAPVPERQVGTFRDAAAGSSFAIACRELSSANRRVPTCWLVNPGREEAEESAEPVPA